jgi:KUP system potassium uptake protein
MLLIGVTGAYNISTHPAVMRACDPSRAVMYFVRTGNYDAMAGVILALTGAEGA